MSESAIHETGVTVRWAALTNLLAGIWLIASPVWLGYSDVEIAQASVGAGAVIVVLALIRAGEPLRDEMLSWLNAIVALCLVVTLFVLGASAVAFWNELLVGTVVLIASWWNALTARHAHHPVRRV